MYIDLANSYIMVIIWVLQVKKSIPVNLNIDNIWSEIYKHHDQTCTLQWHHVRLCKISLFIWPYAWWIFGGLSVWLASYVQIQLVLQNCQWFIKTKVQHSAWVFLCSQPRRRRSYITIACFKIISQLTHASCKMRCKILAKGLIECIYS